MTYRARRERKELRDSRRVRPATQPRRRFSMPPLQSLLALGLVMAVYYGFVGMQHAAAPTVVGETPLLRVVVVDVGQGSSTLLLTAEKSVLIDGGEVGQGSAVQSQLERYGVDRLDLVVASHPHSDHIGGLAELIGVVPVEEVWVAEVPDELVPTNYTYERFLDAIAGVKVTVCDGPVGFELGQGVRLSAIGSFLQFPVSLNDCSLVLRAEAGEASFLIMNDAEVATEDTLLSRGVALESDVLVVGHHGSGTSSRQFFLDAVRPSASAISLGIDNPFGHPHDSVVSRLARFGAIYRTDLNGTIDFATDGQTIAVTADHINDTIDARG